MAKHPPPGKWQYTVGDVPVRLTAFERDERNNRIYTRVWDGRRYGAKQFLYQPIRDRRGRILPEFENAARAAALARQQALASQEFDSDDGGADRNDRRLARSEPLTLGRGLRRVLHPSRGKYAADSQRKRDVTRAARVIQSILKPAMPWAEIRHVHYRQVWRQMAYEHVKTGAHGLRWAEVVCGALQAASRWLQQESLIEPGEGEPARGWKTTLKTEWAEITTQPIRAPAKPRYSVTELRKLWGALRKADPRLALAVELGAELRLGQVARSRRSDVLHSPDGRFEVGVVRVHGRGKKHGELLMLSMEERHALTRAMTRGYLADLERAYRAGEVRDYYLFPGRRLYTAHDKRRGRVLRAAAKNAEIALGKTGFIKQWMKLEEAAGVEHLKGRNWYGVRRRQSDLAEDVEQDARVLNRLGAWRRTATREHYQEDGRPEILAKVTATRRKIRPYPRRGETP